MNEDYFPDRKKRVNLSSSSEKKPGRDAMTDQAIASLHTIFVIIYLQEAAWICAPLLVSGNVFLHAILRGVPTVSLIWAASVFAFFLITGLCLAISLQVVHSKALCQKKPRFFLPYLIVKSIRIATLSSISLTVLLSPTLITQYFYASIYGLFECAAGAIALEVTFRSWRVLAKNRGCPRRRQSASDAPLPTIGLSKQTLVCSAAD